LLGTGKLISDGSLQIQKWSILSNLGNPFFYNYLDLVLKILMVVFLICLGGTLFTRRFHWSILVVFSALIFSFAATPASAFFGSAEQPAQIAWRFGASALVFEAVILFCLVDPIGTWIFKKKIRGIELILIIGLCGLTFWNSYQNLDRIKLNPENKIVLRDQFREGTGMDGYFSPYDYVQKNVRNSVVWVENGLPFYTYGPGLTNTVTRSRPADFYVFINMASDGGIQYPDYVDDAGWISKWKLLYEDSRGRVYQRIPDN